MKHVIYSFFLIAALALLSCGQKMEAVDTLDSAEVAADPSDPLDKALASLPAQDIYANGKTKLIKTLNYRFEVANAKKSMEAIEAAVRKFPAYISGSSVALQNPILENKVTIRVQSEYFADLLKEIDQQALFVNFREVKTEDAAKQFVDLESRLKTKREVEARYQDILRKKAGTVEELFAAEAQIGELQEEIEATVSRINFLKDQVSYSTLNLEFYQTISQEIKAGDAETLADRFAEALATGWEGVVAFGIAVAYVWPLLLVAVFIVLTVRYVKRRRVQVG